MEVSHSILNKLIQIDGHKDPITKSSRDIDDPTIISLYRRWLLIQQDKAEFERDVLDAYQKQLAKITTKFNRDLAYHGKTVEVSKDTKLEESNSKYDDDKLETYTESDFATAISK